MVTDLRETTVNYFRLLFYVPFFITSVLFIGPFQVLFSWPLCPSFTSENLLKNDLRFIM